MATVLAWYYGGVQAIRTVVFTLAAAAAADVVAALILKLVYKTKEMPFDLPTSLVAGWSTALMMSADTPFYLPVAFIALSILAARVGYPLLTKKPTLISADGLSPSLLAVTLLSLFFHSSVYRYPAPDTRGAVWFSADGASLLKMLSEGTVDDIPVVNILTGNLPAPMGTGCLLLMAAALFFVILRRPRDSVMPVSFLLGLSLMSLLIRHAVDPLPLALLCELAGGSAFFIAVIPLSNKRYQPKNPVVAAAFGLVAGVLAVLIRRIGYPQEGACLAALLCNIGVIALNRSSLFKKPDRGPRKQRPVMEESMESYMDRLTNGGENP